MTTRYDTDYAAIQEHVRRARIERAEALADVFASAAEAVLRGVRSMGQLFGARREAEADARFVESDAFLKRWVSRY